MKKEFAFLFVVLLFINLAMAANQSANLSDLKGLVNGSEFSDVKGKTNQILEKEVKIPDNLQIATRILFGLKPEEKVDFNIFILLIAAWLLLFMLLLKIVGVMPFFSGGKSWLATILIMLLAGISGGLKAGTWWLFGLMDFFKFLEGWGVFKLAITLIILIALVFLIMKVANKFKFGQEKGEMQSAGEEAGLASVFGRIFSNAFGRNKND